MIGKFYKIHDNHHEVYYYVRGHLHMFGWKFDQVTLSPAPRIDTLTSWRTFSPKDEISESEYNKALTTACDIFKARLNGTRLHD